MTKQIFGDSAFQILRDSEANGTQNIRTIMAVDFLRKYQQHGAYGWDNQIDVWQGQRNKGELFKLLERLKGIGKSGIQYEERQKIVEVAAVRKMDRALCGLNWNQELSIIPAQLRTIGHRGNEEIAIDTKTTSTADDQKLTTSKEPRQEELMTDMKTSKSLKEDHGAKIKNVGRIPEAFPWIFGEGQGFEVKLLVQKEIRPKFSLPKESQFH
ncbi:hypothetical protein ACOME3_008890 [Neoechinorhynchus agilis]